MLSIDTIPPYHRLESNQCLDLRRVAPYPLDYGGVARSRVALRGSPSVGFLFRRCWALAIAAPKM